MKILTKEPHIAASLSALSISLYLLSLEISYAATTLIGDHFIEADPIATPSEAGDLNVSGNFASAGGIDFGKLPSTPSQYGAMLSYDTASRSTLFDSTEGDAAVLWRQDTHTGIAVSKMILSGSNSLSLFKADGSSAGIILDPNTGSIGVNGSPVLTSSTVMTFLVAEGFLSTDSLDDALGNLESPPTSAAWTDTYMPRGNVSNGAYLAAGNGQASGDFSMAIGYSAFATATHSFAFGFRSYADGLHSTSTSWSNASGIGAVAMGRSTASGDYSVSMGRGSLATGYNSVALSRGVSEGNWSIAAGFFPTSVSFSETVLGTYNIIGNGDPLAFQPSDELFTLGNGTGDTERSNALSTLKNGQTTLTNKAWMANAASPLEDPTTETSDSDGNALIVDGHTILNGKVVISVPQGDISMGVYQ